MPNRGIARNFFRYGIHLTRDEEGQKGKAVLGRLHTNTEILEGRDHIPCATPWLNGGAASCQVLLHKPLWLGQASSCILLKSIKKQLLLEHKVKHRTERIDADTFHSCASPCALKEVVTTDYQHAQAYALP